MNYEVTKVDTFDYGVKEYFMEQITSKLSLFWVYDFRS